ncbi:uncharacterized protein LOC111382586 [Olea europaea var. sylvestris]|uniref:uncharacterized protein LOC111382586 n=1 Tax=Olea europaea var. sylvestris TaxID=158386 RepID=UPI000C1D1903|nr:uncharacterized protein LOC111382586 [Olea europaea var. sylvestris]XP_022862376.1 uncharacterized protein LOC111382586 [Olea europaea var. sylvestris]
MLQLFLSEPKWIDHNANDESAKQKKYLLSELESLIQSLMSSSGRSEARLWLCNTLSGISSISPRRQQELFLSLLTSKPTKQHLAAQLLQLIFDKQPQKVGPIIAKKSYMLQDFFRGNPVRILQWFSNFSGSSGLEHGKGAKALSQFSFVNRDLCWEELEWKGKHGQSPAMVATKPQYFLDLDVQRTVENFLEYVPEFWSSREFSDSLKDGEILDIDTKFFVNLFVDLMYKEDLEEIWEVIDEFLTEESFSFLCHHLLIILNEQELQLFLDMISKHLNPRSESIEYGNASQWLEIILSNCTADWTINQLLLLNAVTTQGRQLLHFVREEGSLDVKEKINKLVFQLCESGSANDLTPIMKECFNRKTIEAIILLGLQSWAIHFRLSEEFCSPESWESLFINNGIRFHKSNKYTLLHDEISEDCGSDLDERSSKRLKSKKKRKQKKKRRRSFDRDESDENELRDFDLSNNRLDLQSKAGDWLLSTDGYSTTWSSVDLPEHLSKHCFFLWLKWVFAKWGDVA